MKNSLSRIERVEREWNWVTTVHAFPTEKLLKEWQRPSYVNGWKGKPNREVFARRDPSWCLNQVIYRIALQHHIPQLLKISHLRKSRTSVFPLSSGASRTYSSLIDSLVDLLLPSTYLIAAIEAEFSYFVSRLKYECSTEQSKTGNVFALALKKTFLFYNQETHRVSRIHFKKKK